MEGGVDWSTARDALHRLDVLTATTDRANQGLESELHRLVEEQLAAWYLAETLLDSSSSSSSSRSAASQGEESVAATAASSSST